MENGTGCFGWGLLFIGLAGYALGDSRALDLMAIGALLIIAGAILELKQK